MAKVKHRSKKQGKSSARFFSLLPKLKKTIFNRLILVWLVLLLAMIALGSNLYRLQIVEGDQLEKKARQQQMVYLRPYIPRRPIIDRQGNVLATDQLVYTLYVHPKLFKISQQEMAENLAPLIQNGTVEDLIQTFQRQRSGIRLAHTLPEDVAIQIQNLSFDGVELIQQYARLYPHQEAVSNVLGYVGFYDRQGQAGIEGSQEKYLERNPLTLRISRTGRGSLMPDHIPEGFANFDDLRLQLTLDLRIQRAANLALQNQIKEYGAKRGLVLVMDVKDGSLLALASQPTYDPNRYFEADMELFKNWAVSDSYEPGSTFKPINVAIALEEGVIKPNDSFNDSGRIYIDRWPISNHDFRTVGGRGMLTIPEILQYSSNIGMIRIMQKLPPQVYYDWLKKLELTEKTDIDLLGEGTGQLKNEAQFTRSQIEPATTAFGQGFSLTPIKLAQLISTLANGGNLVTPHLVKGLVDPQEQIHAQPRRPTPKSVFSPETAQTVLEMMETVVSDGSGAAATIEGYRIAGKTGTAQKASASGGYLANAKITSFVGILPVDNPRYVVIAVIDEPKRENSYGSTVAAPIVKSVMETLISVEGIPPSSTPSEQEENS